MCDKNSYAVDSLFYIQEKGSILANLDDWRWNTREFGEVYLCIDDMKEKVRYSGRGNVEGKLVLELRNSEDGNGLQEIMEAYNARKFKRIFLQSVTA